jgi:hypothetical protein
VLKREFFRKNIFTIGGVVIFILILLVIINPFNSKQTSKEASLKKENKQLKQENVNLLESNEKLKNEQKENSDKLIDRINTLRHENNAQKETIANYQRVFTQLQVHVNSLGIFSPENTIKGDKIAGLIVSDVRRESSDGTPRYYVNFTGEFTVKGTIVRDPDGNYNFIVTEDEVKVPHLLNEFIVSFAIVNKNELFKVFEKDKLEKTALDIECVFKNYNYNYISETKYYPTAEFVRLISHN